MDSCRSSVIIFIQTWGQYISGHWGNQEMWDQWWKITLRQKMRILMNDVARLEGLEIGLLPLLFLTLIWNIFSGSASQDECYITAFHLLEIDLQSKYRRLMDLLVNLSLFYVYILQSQCKKYTQTSFQQIYQENDSA